MKKIIKVSTLILATTLMLLSSVVCASVQTGGETNAEQMSTQDYGDINYPNLFKAWNPELTDQQISDKLEAAWTTYFVDEETKLYFDTGDTGYIKDFYNEDVRSEGISYGMMIAVQMNEQEVFDKLWNFAYTNMRHASGPREGYFAWQVTTDGEILDKNSAPDGEIYMAMALYFASGRWGDGEAIYDYKAQADQLLTLMLHKEDINGGIKDDPNVDPNVIDPIANIFQFDNEYHSGADVNQVVFVPSARDELNMFTDPSYHLPAFYELFSRWAPLNEEYGASMDDRQRWEAIRDASRELFGNAVNPDTGLSPNYSNFDGSPRETSFNESSQYFSYDAWRVSMNWGMDQAWFSPDVPYDTWADALQSFTAPNLDDLANGYTLEGEVVEDYGGSDTGLVAMIATAGLAATNQDNINQFTEALWNADAPTDPSNRYYSGLLYFFGLLNASGQYQIYAPASN